MNKKLVSIITVIAMMMSFVSIANASGINDIDNDENDLVSDYDASLATAANEELNPEEVLTFNSSSGCITGCSPSASGSLVIPQEIGGVDVKSIGERAFSNKTGLTSVVIPDSIVYIGTGAFYGCSALRTVSIGSGVSSALGRKSNTGNAMLLDNVAVFGACYQLEEINVSPDNNYYTSVDGVLFDKNKTKLILYPASKDSTSYSIPDGITSLSPDSFKHCMFLTDVVMPDSVNNVGDNVFSESSNLKNVKLSGSISSITSSMFSNCSVLESIDIPDSVKTIDYSAFSRCYGLKSITIPSSVSKINSEAFYYCKSLKAVSIPDAITNISEGTFNNCEGLESISIPENVKSINEKAFSSCKSLESITLPSGLTSIGKSAFYGCKNLKSITIPDQITTIDDNMFEDCANLESITLPDGITVIGSSAFKSCKGLKEITIPAKITVIKAYTFENCSKLENVILPLGLTQINSYAFRNCIALKNITIPNQTTVIGSAAFYYTGLESITLSNSVSNIGSSAFYYCDKLKDVYYFGTKDEWNGITIAGNNSSLTNANKHFSDDDEPIEEPTATPTAPPTAAPTVQPTATPTARPSNVPVVFCWGRYENEVIMRDHTPTDIVFKGVNGISLYKIVLYKNDEYVDCCLYDTGTVLYEDDEYEALNLRDDIVRHGAGKYTCTISSCHGEDSDYDDYDDLKDVPVLKTSEFSPVFNYVLPAAKLAQPSNIRIVDGVLYFDHNPGKYECSYNVSFKARYGNGAIISIGSHGVKDKYLPASSYTQWVENYNRTVDRLYNMNPSKYDKNNVEMVITVQAISRDILVCQDSDISEYGDDTVEEPVFNEITLPDMSGYPGSTLTVNNIYELTPDDMKSGLAYVSDYYGFAIDKNPVMTFSDNNAKNSYTLDNIPLHWVRQDQNHPGPYDFELAISIPQELDAGVYTLTIVLDVAQSKDGARPVMFTINNFTVLNNNNSKNVLITDRTSKIGDEMFSGMDTIESIVIPNSVSVIGNSAFSYCTALKTINIPDGVKEIGSSAFSGCSSLESVGISGNISSINEGAFANCTSLSDIYYTGSEEQWEAIEKKSAKIPDGAIIHYNYTPQTYKYIVNEPDISNGKVEVKIDKVDEPFVGTEVLLAQYDKNGALVGFEKKSIYDRDENGTLKFETDTSGADNAKIFIWDAAGMNKPMSTVFGIQL